jgi:uncharacterized membrane protein
MTWLILIGVAVAAVFIIKDKKFSFGGSSDAEDELKKRYVNSEIDEETYLRMKENIKK